MGFRKILVGKRYEETYDSMNYIPKEDEKVYSEFEWYEDYRYEFFCDNCGYPGLWDLANTSEEMTWERSGTRSVGCFGKSILISIIVFLYLFSLFNRLLENYYYDIAQLPLWPLLLTIASVIFILIKDLSIIPYTYTKHEGVYCPNWIMSYIVV